MGFKHNMCLRGGIVSLFDFCFLCWTRLSRSKCSSIAKADNSFEKERLKVEQVTGKFEK